MAKCVCVFWETLCISSEILAYDKYRIYQTYEQCVKYRVAAPARDRSTTRRAEVAIFSAARFLIPRRSTIRALGNTRIYAGGRVYVRERRELLNSVDHPSQNRIASIVNPCSRLFAALSDVITSPPHEAGDENAIPGLFHGLNRHRDNIMSGLHVKPDRENFRVSFQTRVTRAM